MTQKKTLRAINRSAEQYQQQLNSYHKQFADAITSGASEEDLDTIYNQLDKAWRRTAAIVNTSNKGIALNVDAFEKRITKMMNHAKQAAAAKATEITHIEETNNAEKDFIKALITPVLIALAFVLLFLIFINL